MARANISAAVDDLKQLYETPFGGKRVGRFVVNRDQIAELLRVKVAHDKTILLLSAAALNDADLVLAQSGGSLYSVVSVRKAAKWRKVPRATLSDLVGPIVANEDHPAEDINGDDDDD